MFSNILDQSSINFPWMAETRKMLYAFDNFHFRIRDVRKNFDLLFGIGDSIYKIYSAMLSMSLPSLIAAIGFLFRPSSPFYLAWISITQNLRVSSRQILPEIYQIVSIFRSRC